MRRIWADLPNRSPGIYAITSAISGESYVGATLQIRDRIARHFGRLERGRHYNKRMQEQYNAHGIEIFSVRVLELCSLRTPTWDGSDDWWERSQLAEARRYDWLREREAFHMAALAPVFNVLRAPEPVAVRLYEHWHNQGF